MDDRKKGGGMNDRRKSGRRPGETAPPPHTEPKGPTRWSAVNLPNWLLHLYLADLLVLLLLEVVVEVEVESKNKFCMFSIRLIPI